MTWQFFLLFIECVNYPVQLALNAEANGTSNKFSFLLLYTSVLESLFELIVEGWFQKPSDMPLIEETKFQVDVYSCSFSKILYFLRQYH